MSVLEAIIFGIVEGITEFLPISSTGHLIITGDLLSLPQTEFLKSFEIAIQLGAILSVVVLYWRSFLVDIETLKRIIVAFVPTAIIGLLLYKVIKGYLLGSLSVVLWSLFLGGIAIVIFEKWHKEGRDAEGSINALSYKKAAIIGVFQALAVIPGVSRAAATILGGLWLGLKRKTIVEFSFLLAVPTMLAATVFDLAQSAPTFSSQEFQSLAIGFITSFIVAIFAIKFLLLFIKNHDFKVFGWYRIALSLIFLLFLI